MLSAHEITRQVRAREVSAVSHVQRAFRVIDEHDDVVRAWSHLDRSGALGRAVRVDDGACEGTVSGIPVGVKDIFDTVGMPTEFGSKVHRGRRPVRNAAVLSLLVSAGAIPVGKTRTTEFAFFSPGPTVNPHNPGRTPGGSSSGSAAAVAAGMVPVALGSQTAGSIIRPAAYCGVVGYKPSFGLVPRAGVLVFAESLDTVGVFVRAVADAELFGAAMMGLAEIPVRVRSQAAVDRPTLILCRTDEWGLVDSSGQRAVERAVSVAVHAGAEIVERELPVASSALVQAHKTVMAFEASRALAFEASEHLESLSLELRHLLDVGAGTPFVEYREALALRDVCRNELENWWGTADALLTPASLGEAPAGLAATGDPLVNRVWTLLGLPCVALPTGSGVEGMPVAVQIVGRAFDDGEVLRRARWLEEQLRN